MFIAKDLSINAQTFLYACAFWTVAADEELKSGEQRWLTEQFGEDGATDSLQDFVELESDAFFEVLNNAINALTDDEKRLIYPSLEEWLMSCALADGQEVAGEHELAILHKLKEYLDLDNQVAAFQNETDVKSELESDLQDTDDSAAAAANADVSEVRILRGHESEVTCLSLSDDGRILVSGSEDCTVRLWDYETGKQNNVLEKHVMGVTCVKCIKGINRVLSGDRLGLVVNWDMEQGSTVWEIKRDRTGGITGIDVSYDGRYVVTSSDTGILSIHDAGTGAFIRSFGEKKNGAVSGVAFSPDARYVLSGGDDRNLRLWTVEGELIRVFSGHSDGVMSVAFSSNGKMAVSGSRDNTLRTWNIDDGAELKEFTGHSFTVKDACFSPDDSCVLSGSWDHTARLWSVNSGKELYKLESLTGRFSAVLFNDDARQLVAGDSDKLIHMVRIV